MRFPQSKCDQVEAPEEEILNGKQQRKDRTSAGRVLDLYLQTKAMTTSLARDS